MTIYSIYRALRYDIATARAEKRFDDMRESQQQLKELLLNRNK